MRFFNLRFLPPIAALLLVVVAAFPLFAENAPGAGVKFVPNSQEFWDNSKHWTTNYGPAYRDTVLSSKSAGPYFVPCTGTYALCFHSGPAPLPCVKSADGRFAECKCTVQEGVNWVLITGILNYEIYEKTIKTCGVDGSGCAKTPDKAPVCAAIKSGTLIPGAEAISTFSQDDATSIADRQKSAPAKPPLTICPKGPYAGCMTAGCKKTTTGYAECACPIFWGPFQLTQAGASCSLGGDLVWSSAYDPTLDTPQ
jgi:hypothetical protein